MEPLSRRAFTSLSLGAFAYLVGGRPTRAAPPTPDGPRLVCLWLHGGPSQLETFDPKPGLAIGGPTRAIDTSIPGIKLAEGLPQTAEQLQHLALIRSMVSQEGDHERGNLFVRSGYRPDVTLEYPTLGALLTHEEPVDGAEIPSYVSILDPTDYSKGGYLGPEVAPFRIGDPRDPVRDIQPRVSDARQARRLEGLNVLEEGFAGRRPYAEKRSKHRDRTARALEMMRSEHLAAFEVEDEPRAVRAAYGDTPFGRGCLAARRLLEVGVRCVEVTLTGWDTHIDNFTETSKLCETLDPALASLTRELRERDLWEDTVLVCGGEFGRTPRINKTEGRDHWPKGFSMLLGGGRIRGGQVLGATGDGEEAPVDPVSVQQLCATVFAGLGLDPTTETISPIGRPLKLADGEPLKRLLV